MLFRLRKSFYFEASHQLMHHDGKCRNLHGHSWKGTVEVSGHNLKDGGPKQNMLVDYADLGSVVNEVCKLVDHKHLNDVFKTEMPTSEWIARELFILFQEKLVGLGLTLNAVTIAETCTTECRYELERGIF